MPWEHEFKDARVGYEPTEYYVAWFGPYRTVKEAHDLALKARTELLKKHAPTPNHVKIFEMTVPNGPQHFGIRGEELLKGSGLEKEELNTILLWLSDESLHEELKGPSTELFYVYGLDHNDDKEAERAKNRVIQTNEDF